MSPHRNSRRKRESAVQHNTDHTHTHTHCQRSLQLSRTDDGYDRAAVLPTGGGGASSDIAALSTDLRRSAGTHPPTRFVAPSRPSARARPTAKLRSEENSTSDRNWVARGGLEPSSSSRIRRQSVGNCCRSSSPALIGKVSTVADSWLVVGGPGLSTAP